jgi:hypothetical protein
LRARPFWTRWFHWFLSRGLSDQSWQGVR